MRSPAGKLVVSGGLIAILILLVGGVTVAITINVQDRRNREAHDTTVARAAAEAPEKANGPVATDIEILLRRLEAMELMSAARFESLKARIFWTPLLWATISLALWVLAYMVMRGA